MGSRQITRTKQTTVQLIDSATPGGVQPAGKSGLTLVFSDEFTGGTLDRLKWDPWYPDTAFWNAPGQGYPGHKTNTNEPEVYDPSGITFDGSAMTFTMRNEASVPAPYNATWPYTSGMVTSYPSFNPTYGFFEARMKLNVTRGLWPAFWMDRTDQQWPPEIDWMEHNLYGSTIISGMYHSGSGETTTTVTQTDNLTPTAWHTYGGEWRNGRIDWYFDGTIFKTLTGTLNTQPMYLICNLAGMPWDVPAAGDLPQSVQVDYIRAWA